MFYIKIHYFFVDVGDSGKSHKPAYVVLVGTHADKANIRKTSNGDYSSKQTEELKQKVLDKFGNIFNLEETLLMIDCHAAGSPDIKTFKSVVQQRKQQLIEVSVNVALLYVHNMRE